MVAGTPANSIGVNTEFYIDTTNSILFGPKASNVWPSTGVNLIGPEGAHLVSAEFTGNDIRFTDSFTPTARTFDLVNAVQTLKGDKGDTGNILDLESKTTSFVAETGKLYNINISAAINITLPTLGNNIIFTIKDVSGSLSTNNATLIRNGSESIDGLPVNRILETNFGSWTIYSDGSNWFIL